MVKCLNGFKSLSLSLSFSFSLSLFFFFSTAAESWAQIKESSCIEKRGALDIGSGSTKLLVAEVDHCAGILLKIIWSKKIKVPFQEDLLKDESQLRLSEQIQREAQQAIGEMLKEAKEKFSIQKFSAVATAAFRLAKNGPEVAQKLEKELSLKVRIIDQVEEGRLGFWGSCAQVRNEHPTSDCQNELWVWDIGGGSMQISTYDGEGNYQLYEGKLGAVAFKNLIIEGVLGKDSSKKSSPNPLGKKNGSKSARLSQFYALLHVPPHLGQLATQRKVVGIGGVHNLSVIAQLKRANPHLERSFYEQKDLESLLTKKVLLTDKALQSDYAETEVTNMLLVLGFMKALKIEKVQVTETDLNQGLLLEKTYWF